MNESELSVQLVPAFGKNVKSPSASIVTDPPSLEPNVPAWTTSGPGPSGVVVAVEDVAGDRLLRSGDRGGPVARIVDDERRVADSAEKLSLSALGASLVLTTLMSRVTGSRRGRAARRRRPGRSTVRVAGLGLSLVFEYPTSAQGRLVVGDGVGADERQLAGRRREVAGDRSRCSVNESTSWPFW